MDDVLAHDIRDGEATPRNIHQLRAQVWIRYRRVGHIIFEHEVHVAAGRHARVGLDVGHPVGDAGLVPKRDAVGEVVGIDAHGSIIRKGRVGDAHLLLQQTRLRIEVHLGDDGQRRSFHDDQAHGCGSPAVAAGVHRHCAQTVITRRDVRQREPIRRAIRDFADEVRAEVERHRLNRAGEIKHIRDHRDVAGRDVSRAIGRTQNRDCGRGRINERDRLTAGGRVAAGINCAPSAGHAIGATRRIRRRAAHGQGAVRRSWRVEIPGRARLHRLVRHAGQRRRGGVVDRHGL